MGDGNTSSYRWQNDRKLSWEERANYYINKYLALKEEHELLIAKCRRQEKELDKYEQALSFKKGDNL